MIHKLILFTLLLLLVGCQKEVLDPIDDNCPNADGSVGFRLKTDDIAEMDEFQTRGIPHNTLENYSTVNVNVYSHTSDYNAGSNDTKLFQEIELKQKESKWDYTPHLFWPGVKKLSFMAYSSDVVVTDAGITFTPSTGAPESITYTVPSDVTKQPDLLVSTLFNQSKVDNVFLCMKHALSCISFCGDTPDKSVYVKKIALRNVYGTGTLALDSPSIQWQIDADSKGITVFEAGIKNDEELQQSPTAPNYLMTETGYLMMLPQALKDAAIDVFYWNGKDEKDNKIITYTLPTDNPSYANWKPGHKYVYKFGTQSDDVTVVYYEKYADSYGFYDGTTSSLQDNKEILEAGYGAVSKKTIGNVAAIRLSNPMSTAVISGAVMKLADGTFLYPVSQSAGSTFTLPTSTIPQNVYFNGSAKSCGMIVPHFAKGVYTTVQTAMTIHSIRTPQQMRNITQSDASSTRNTHTYTQELDLDFSKESIGGGTLTTAVVNRQFNDLFNADSKRIQNVTIYAYSNGGLFQGNSGEINNVVLVNSSISSGGNTGGIVAVNKLNGVIRDSRIIGESSSKPFTIIGISGYTGAIAGFNSGEIIGNQKIENATEIPIAEVSGWVSITGAHAGTGGIVGQNEGTITTCLVNGVYVTGTTVQPAKINIVGEQYVGGIVGLNMAQVFGNFSVENGAEPDVAGVVSITSKGNWVGGIAGSNKGTKAVLNQVNLRLGYGDDAIAITITGQESVGGIVGINESGGTLKADANSFISVRGNVRITGTEMVGGIVGNNQSGNISNCFVYNFFSQTYPLVHYAPKIFGNLNVGGIVGYAGDNNATITNCAVFSTVSVQNASLNENIQNAKVEIKSKADAAGGIVGRSISGLTLDNSYVLGNVSINAGRSYVGGIVGNNNTGTKIAHVHIGNSSAEVTNVYVNLFDKVHLPVRDERMKTSQGVMTKTSGTPTVTGYEYIGGICGLNYGEIDGIEMNDNVQIGTTTSNYVGGITGGNTLDAVVKNCKTYNPLSGAIVEIVGYLQVGGIIGLNNGIVEKCHVGLEGMGQSNLIIIKGTGILGGIAGSTGGNVTGNANTRIADCNIYGKVRIDGNGENIGGIIGQNQPTSKVVNCNVIGYKSTYTNADNYDYDVTVNGSQFVGGIAGSNLGEIYGSPSYSTVTHTAVSASYKYAGGLVGLQQSTQANVGKLYNCDVSRGVLIFKWNLYTGVFVGQLDGQDGTSVTPILFGTKIDSCVNKIYTGTTSPVIVSANNTKVILPPQIGNMPEYCPDPPTTATGNLWTMYAPFNYLHYITYQ